MPRRPTIYLGFAVAVALLGASLKNAVERIATFPEHRGYEATEGFLHFSVGGLDRVDEALLDENGVRLFDYGGSLGIQYNPLFVADFILSLVPFTDAGRARHLLVANLDWLEGIAESAASGNRLFPYKFDFEKVGETAPWYSAMAQGRIGQAMMWGWRLTDDPRYLALAKKAILAMAEQGPSTNLAKPLVRGVWLKEFPRYPYHVLDGSLVATVGVSEVLRGLPEDDAQRAEIRALLDESIAGFKANSHCFTSPVGGVLFADNGRLPTQAYYDIIMDQLAYLSNLEPEIESIATRYSLLAEGYALLAQARALLLVSIEQAVASRRARGPLCALSGLPEPDGG